MSEHNFGTALIFARTETKSFFAHVWDRASAVLFIRGRLHFHVPADRWINKNGVPRLVSAGRVSTNSGAPSVLVAYGSDDADVLACCSIDGQFVPLRIPRSVLVEAIAPTWSEVVSQLMSRYDGPVPLAELYRAAAVHPKARRNPHFADKIRQILQKGEGKRYRRADRGLWQAI